MWMTLEHLVPCELFTMELDGCGREGGREREKDTTVIFIRCP